MARGRRRIVKQTAQHDYRVHQRLAVCRVQPGKLRLDRAGPVSADPVKSLQTLCGDLNADRTGVAGIDRSGDQAGVFEPSHLRGHRRLRAVIHRGQITDPRFAMRIDG